MTYTLGSYVSGLGTNPPAPEPPESTPEGSVWYKVTPTVLALATATYPSYSAVRQDVVERAGRELVFIGLPPGGNEMYFLSAGSTGNFSRPASSTVPYAAPPGAPRMTYQQVLDVFAIRGGGPKFKRKQYAKTYWGLLAGVGVAAAALAGMWYWSSKRQQAPKPLTSNRRRRVNVKDRSDEEVVYAIPERKAYPITTDVDAKNATKRLKQGRVKDEADANRIIAAIRSKHHDIWREYLEGYPVSKIMASKRKGLAARRSRRA